jgi:hypothetical protein
VELPDGGGARRRTPLVPWVVAGAVQGTALYISEPPLLTGSRPAREWAEVVGPVRIVTEAEWVRLLRAAGVDVEAALGTLSPLERAELGEG